MKCRSRSWCVKTRWRRLLSHLGCRWISPHVRTGFCASASEPGGYQAKTQENVQSTAPPDKRSFSRPSLSNSKSSLSRTVLRLRPRSLEEPEECSEEAESISTRPAGHKHKPNINGSAEGVGLTARLKEWGSLLDAPPLFLLSSVNMSWIRNNHPERRRRRNNKISFYNQKP